MVVCDNKSSLMIFFNFVLLVYITPHEVINDNYGEKKAKQIKIFLYSIKIFSIKKFKIIFCYMGDVLSE